MDARQADLLKQSDPMELGRRLRAVRVAKGMTQSDVAGQGMSVAYVSRMESGQRRPTARVLARLAHRLEVPIEQILGGMVPREVDEIRMTLDYAELSLESGEPQEAATRAHQARERLGSRPVDGLDERARLIHARALEALGKTDDAIIELEGLTGDDVAGLTRIKAGIALSRAHREYGDLGRAIETGERVLTQVEASGLGGCGEAVQLAVTVAAAHFERGDSGHAVRVCHAAITKAEALGSPTARAAAYWNASVMQASRGALDDAVTLAERALALLGEGQDARNLARLRAQLGRIQLTLDPPDVAQAQQNLEQAAEELTWSSGAPVDRVWIDLGRARARFLTDDIPGALELIWEVTSLSGGHVPLAEAEAKALEGQARARQGDASAAATAYQDAVLLMTAVGADRGAAQLWFDLAGLLQEIGMGEAAMDAYRRAAASTGLRARTGAPARSLV